MYTDALVLANKTGFPCEIETKRQIEKDTVASRIDHAGRAAVRPCWNKTKATRPTRN